MAQTHTLTLMAQSHGVRPTEYRDLKKPETVECWRCGVVFDSKWYVPGAPCVDCQFEDQPNEWTRFDEVKEFEENRKDRHIERLWKRRYSDNEIADALGLTRNMVRSRRDKLGLEAHIFTGDEKWKDPEAVRAAIGDRMRGNSYKQGWGPGQKHGKPVTSAEF